ncbi:MAG: ABC transporter substrate-binding protein [Desulfarculaceae bacterium]|nr:ABC transporter substrate-binding protein [Desulfarculaceae bacterium]
MKKITRRDFMKTTGAATLGAAAVGTGLMSPRKAFSAVPMVRMAYILSDHHAPLIVAASEGERFQQDYGLWLKPLNQGKLYELSDKGGRLARVQLIPTKKGPDVERLVAQGSVDIAISGTQAILMTVDRGVDSRIVSPLQTAGNVFVVDKKLEINDWASFVSYVKGQGRQFKIGFPGPQTVAAIIFRSALEYEGVSYTENAADRKADVLFVNMKGHGNLVAALSNNITQAIIGAQPFPAVTIDRGVGRMILDLQDVPPNQRWYGHACCSLEATGPFMKNQAQLAQKMLTLMALGSDLCQKHKEVTAKACSAWLGVPVSVETVAMETLTYTTDPTKHWQRSVDLYAQTMDSMKMFNGKLKGAQGDALANKAFDFTAMNQVRQELKAAGRIS